MQCHAMNCKLQLGLVAGVFQLVFLVLFAVFAKYDDEASGSYKPNSIRNGTDPAAHNSINKFYPMFQDVHVMMFVGFGFLMTFLRRYGFSSVSFNMLITVFVLQWALILGGFLSFIHHPAARFAINIEGLINADFAAAAVLISFGAVLGKTSPVQMLVIAFIEIICFKVNEYIGLDIMQVTDVGGSMFVHVFGAYFGLALTRVIHRGAVTDHANEGSIYHSDAFAMIGTLFLWMYWPSFNSAMASGDQQHRAVINTYIALASCCLTTFAMSSLVNEQKLDMVHIQNATLAGGVAVGTSANLMLYPAGAAGVGILAAILSVLGYKFLMPLLASKLKIHDTCGVNNLHGMPGLLAGLIGAVMAGVADQSQYYLSLYEIFPAMAPGEGPDLSRIQSEMPDVEAGLSRTAAQQAGFQLAALFMTLTVALVTGALTGLLVRWDFFDPPSDDDLYDDSPWFETPDDYVKNSLAHAFAGLPGLGLAKKISTGDGPRRGSTIPLTENSSVESAPSYGVTAHVKL